MLGLITLLVLPVILLALNLLGLTDMSGWLIAAPYVFFAGNCFTTLAITKRFILIPKDAIIHEQLVSDEEMAELMKKVDKEMADEAK